MPNVSELETCWNSDTSASLSIDCRSLSLPRRYDTRSTPLTVRAVLSEVPPCLVLEERKLFVRLCGVTRLVFEPGGDGEDEPGSQLPRRPPKRSHVGLVLGLDDADALS